MSAQFVTEPSIYHWSLPETLSSEDIEVASMQLQKSNELVLDITDLKRAGIGAEGRLLALLVSAKRQNKTAKVQAQHLSDPIDPSGIILLLTTTIVGLILGRMTDSIADYEGNEYIVEIRRLQSEHLKSTKGYFSNSTHKSFSSDFCAPIVDEFGRPPTPIIWKQREPAPFTFYLKKCLSQNIEVPDDVRMPIELINDYIFEAFQNTFDHASKDLNDYPIHGVRFISVRSYNMLSTPLEEIHARATNLATHTAINPIGLYFSHLQDLIANEQDKGSNMSHLLEITIADSGYGIPARMKGSENSIELSIEAEKELLQQALMPGGSSKPNSVVGAGLGLFKMMESVYRLEGLVLFRTGKLNMYKYYLKDNSQWPSISGVNSQTDNSLQLHHWDNTPSGYLSGTCISLIFPLRGRRKESSNNEPILNAVESEPKQLELSI